MVSDLWVTSLTCVESLCISLWGYLNRDLRTASSPVGASLVHETPTTTPDSLHLPSVQFKLAPFLVTRSQSDSNSSG